MPLKALSEISLKAPLTTLLPRNGNTNRRSIRRGDAGPQTYKPSLGVLRAAGAAASLLTLCAFLSAPARAGWVGPYYEGSYSYSDTGDETHGDKETGGMTDVQLFDFQNYMDLRSDECGSDDNLSMSLDVESSALYYWDGSGPTPETSWLIGYTLSMGEDGEVNSESQDEVTEVMTNTLSSTGSYSDYASPQYGQWPMSDSVGPTGSVWYIKMATCGQQCDVGATTDATGNVSATPTVTMGCVLTTSIE